MWGQSIVANYSKFNCDPIIWNMHIAIFLQLGRRKNAKVYDKIHGQKNAFLCPVFKREWRETEA